MREASGAITAMVACRYCATHSVRVVLGDVAAGSATDPDASVSAVARSWQPSSAAALKSAYRSAAYWLAGSLTSLCCNLCMNLYTQKVAGPLVKHVLARCRGSSFDVSACSSQVTPIAVGTAFHQTLNAYWRPTFEVVVVAGRQDQQSSL